MGKMKKIKQGSRQARHDAERAERAAERAEEAYRRIYDLVGTSDTNKDSQTERERSPFYTSPAGQDATPAAAEVR